jgi:phage shock protein PspC (stress-responsive transcriptional regulator)
MQKKLYRKREGKVLAGVCGGIADYFDLDPTVIRVIWALLAATGSGVLAYIICALIIPEAPYDDYE